MTGFSRFTIVVTVLAALLYVIGGSALDVQSRYNLATHMTRVENEV